MTKMLMLKAPFLSTGVVTLQFPVWTGYLMLLVGSCGGAEQPCAACQDSQPQWVTVPIISLLLPSQLLILLSSGRSVPALFFKNAIISASVGDIAALHKGITARLKGLWSLSKKKAEWLWKINFITVIIAQQQSQAELQRLTFNLQVKCESQSFKHCSNLRRLIRILNLKDSCFV